MRLCWLSVSQTPCLPASYYSTLDIALNSTRRLLFSRTPLTPGLELQLCIAQN